MNDQSPNRLFLGELDLHHGFELNRTSVRSLISELKIGALFNEKLIIPDGYVHCYGPISGALLKSKNCDQWDNILRNTLEYFFEKGILVPVVRGDGKSIYKNWRGSKFGAVPGLGMTLHEKYDYHLAYLDSIVHPEKAPNRTKNLNRDLVFSTLIEEIGHPDIEEPTNRSSLSGILKSLYKNDKNVIRPSLDLISNLHSKVLGDKNSFRRASVEDFLLEELDRDLGKKNRVRELYYGVTAKSRIDRVKQVTAYGIINTLTTSYQFENSLAFNSSSKLYDLHDKDIITSAFYEKLTKTRLTAYPPFLKDIQKKLEKSKSIVKANHNIVEQIDLDTINSIRSEGEYSKFLLLKSKAHSSSDEGDWEQFIDFSINVYVPYLMKKFQEVEIRDNREKLNGYKIFSFGLEDDRIIIRFLDLFSSMILSVGTKKGEIGKLSEAMIDERYKKRSRALVKSLEGKYNKERNKGSSRMDSSYSPFLAK